MIGSRLVVGAAIALIASLLWFGLIRSTRPSKPRAGASDGGKVGFTVGEYAPDFELRSVNGSSFKLSALRGQPVVLNFWGTWCAPCKVEIPWLVQLDQTYRSQGVQIVGVAMESGGSEDITKFAEEHGMKYSIVLGNSATADEYGGVRFMPQSFFISRDGRIVKETIGLTDKKDLEDGVKALLEGNTKSQVARGGRP
jgi:peroxiredoxin